MAEKSVRIRIIFGDSVDVSALGLGGERKLLMALPPGLVLVADLVRELNQRLQAALTRALYLAVDDFVLLPAQWLREVVRDGDVVTASLPGESSGAGGAAAAARAAPSHGGEDAAAPAPAASGGTPKQRQRRGRQRHSEAPTAEVSPTTNGWVEALSSKISTSPPVSSVDPGGVVRSKPDEAESLAAAKKAATAALEAASELGLRAASVALEEGKAKAPERSKAAAGKAATAALEAASELGLKAASVALEEGKARAPERSKAAAGKAPAAGAAAGEPPPARQQQQQPLPPWPPAPAAQGVGGKRKATSYGGVAKQFVALTHPLLGELEVPSGEDSAAFVGKKLKTLSKAVRRQMEHYFGDVNWARDAHIRMLADDDGFVPIARVTDFERLKSLTTDVAFIAESSQASEVLEVSSCRKLVRRRKREDG